MMNMGGFGTSGGLTSGGGGVVAGHWDLTGLLTEIRVGQGIDPHPYQIPPPSYPPQMIAMQRQIQQQYYNNSMSLPQQ